MKKTIMLLIIVAAFSSCKSNLDHAVEHGTNAVAEGRAALAAGNNHESSIPHLEKGLQEQKITVSYLQKFVDDPGWFTPSYQVTQVRRQIDEFNENIANTEDIIKQRKAMLRNSKVVGIKL